jgi:rRNA maturation endonuclease Nob1
MSVEMENTILYRLRILGEKLQALEDRFNAINPPRYHCPHCKALVHKEARACAACGRSWGEEPNPRAGLPR